MQQVAPPTSEPQRRLPTGAGARRPPPARLRRRRRHPSRGRLAGPLFSAPALVFYLALVIVPLVLAFTYSVTDKNLLYPTTHYVGGSNYRDLWHDGSFRETVTTTAILAAMIVVAPNVLGLGVALLLRGEGRFYALLRTIFFVPQVLSAVVISFLWQTMLTDDGILNSLLSSIGLGSLQQPWLDDTLHARIAVGLVVTWQFIGFCAVLYLAALKAIPGDLLEAAAVDGCGGWHRFRHITWPLVAPALTINTVLLLIVSFKLFDHVKVMTDGGPGEATTTLALGIYNTAFIENAYGYASAMAVVLFVIAATLSALAVTLLRRREVTY